jgi:hypothetical protein
MIPVTMVMVVVDLVLLEQTLVCRLGVLLCTIVSTLLSRCIASLVGSAWG